MKLCLTPLRPQLRQNLRESVSRDRDLGLRFFDGAGAIEGVDPRIPDELERFALEVEGLPDGARVEWWIDGAVFAESREEGGRALRPFGPRLPRREGPRCPLWKAAVDAPISDPPAAL